MRKRYNGDIGKLIPIPGHERYFLDESLNIVSLRTGKYMLISLHYCRGYLVTSTQVNKKYIHYYSHRLIALTFIPNPENKPFINHKNGIKDDNRIENLEWCTAKENSQHASTTGLLNPIKGEDRPSSKLNPLKVKEIRVLLSQGLSHRKIGKMYGVDNSSVARIKSGRLWGYVK